MTYRRAGRPSWYFQSATRHGWAQLCARTADRRLADKIEVMWHTLSSEHRAWDVLDLVLSKQMKVGELFDLWRDSGRRVTELRRRLNDVDLEPLVADFLKVHASKVQSDTLEHITYHVRWLIPAGTVFPRSQANVERLTGLLYDYEGEPGTIRKVHSDWSVFFAYATDVRELFERNPMEKVKRPPVRKPLVRFYELDAVDRIVGYQPTEERRALFALLYGTGMEISVALTLTRGDLLETRKEVRAAGTKTHTRDRMARVADWAWPTMLEHARALLPASRLFPAVLSRHTASDWHRETTKALDLPEILPMKNARHHWAVRMLRSGAPVGVVQNQLGHATAKLTLDTYGQFMPTGADRDKWEQVATDAEKARLSAADSANREPLPLTSSRGGT